jgi:predicted dehydrogenase
MIKGAVIGFGRMGITHFSILNTHPAVSMVGVCDPSSFVVRAFERHTSVRGFTDSRRLFDSAALDFVVIATPTSSHHELVKQALARGVHVFVEKPLTLHGLDSQQIVEDSGRSGLVNQVGYVNRFNEVFLAAKELLSAGVLGAVHHFRCAMYAPTVLRESRGGWRGERKTGGGCLLDFASHGIDLVQFMFGTPHHVAGSSMHSIHSRGADDAVYSNFLYRNGMSGHIAVNWSDGSYRKPAYRIEVEAANGRLGVDQHGYKLFLSREPQGSDYIAGWNVRAATDLTRPVRFYLRGNEFTRQLDYFVERVASLDTTNINSFSSAAATDKLTQDILDDAGVG